MGRKVAGATQSAEVGQFLGRAGDVRRKTAGRIEREVGQVQPGDEWNPPGRTARFALSQSSIVVEVEQPVVDELGQIVAAEVDEQHVVEVLPGVEAPVGEVRLRGPVAVDAEVQHGEVSVLAVLVEQVVQRLGEDVGRIQGGRLRVGIAEDAHGRPGDQVGVREVPVLPQAQVVGVEGMAASGVWMHPPVPRVRQRREDAHGVRRKLAFRNPPVLREDETQGRFAKQGREEHRRRGETEPRGELLRILHRGVLLIHLGRSAAAGRGHKPGGAQEMAPSQPRLRRLPLLPAAPCLCS